MVLRNGGYSSGDLIMLYHLTWRSVRTVEDLLRLLPREAFADTEKADYTAFLNELRESLEGLRDGATQAV